MEKWHELEAQFSGWAASKNSFVQFLLIWLIITTGLALLSLGIVLVLMFIKFLLWIKVPGIIVALFGAGFGLTVLLLMVVND